MKKFLLGIAALALPLAAACSDVTQPATPSAPKDLPTARLDPATGEIVSTLAATADRIEVYPGQLPGSGPSKVIVPPEECDPTYQICEPPCDPYDPNSPCYEPPCTTPSVISYTYDVRTGSDPYHALEGDGNGYESCGGYNVLIGVGIRLTTSDNIATLWLKYQRINPDGSFGYTVLKKYGTDPYHTPEAEGYLNVSGGNYVVTGVGVATQGTHNIRALRLYYKPVTLTSSGLRTYGSRGSTNYGYVPGATIENSYALPEDNTTDVYVGLGGRGHNSSVTTLAHHIGVF